MSFAFCPGCGQKQLATHGYGYCFTCRQPFSPRRRHSRWSRVRRRLPWLAIGLLLGLPIGYLSAPAAPAAVPGPKYQGFRYPEFIQPWEYEARRVPVDPCLRRTGAPSPESIPDPCRPTRIPEPGSLVLIGAGLVLLRMGGR